MSAPITGHLIQLKNEADRYFPNIQDSLAGFVDKLDDFHRKSDSSKGLVRFNMEWPSISLGGKMELKEAKDDFNVDIGGEISFAMDPLIKADVRMDILEWLLKFTAIGPFLQEVKNKAAKGIGNKKLKAKAVVAIDIVVTGEITATLKWEKSVQDTWLSTEGKKSGEAGAGVTIGLEAKILAEAKIFYVKIKLGAELHIKGDTDKTTAEGIGNFGNLYAEIENEKPAIGGKVKFTGAAIYYVYYAEVGTDEIDSKNPEISIPGRDRDELEKNTIPSIKTYTEKKMAKLVTIFKENELPKHSILNTNTPLTEINL